MADSNQNNLPVMTGQNVNEEDQSLQLADLWALVWDHKWWYVICILVALMIASFYLYKTPKPVRTGTRRGIFVSKLHRPSAVYSRLLR